MRAGADVARSPRRLRVAAALLLGTAVLSAALPAQAAQAGYGQFDPLSGTSRDFTTTMQQRPAGFPAAAVRSTSVGGSAVGVQSGSSAFLPPQTPVGQKYGSSQGQAYLTLRPNGLSAAPPSVTTYTFARPTPGSGWAFILGDVDADAVAIAATDADGDPVEAGALGFRGGFNYCAPGVTPKPSCAQPNNDGTDLPTWEPSTATLTGNPGAADTAGASGWFEPQVPLTTLTLTYTRRAGSPVYQTWFTALSYGLSGVVTAPAGAQQGLTVRLYDPAGNLTGSTLTDGDGRYTFPGQATYDDYRVELVRPSGFISDEPLAQRVDLSAGDQQADFSLRAIVPASAGGTVRTDDGQPVPDVTIIVTGPDGFSATTTTGADGGYVVDDLPAGAGYAATISAPAGFAANPIARPFDVPADSEQPITGLDFVLTAAPVGSVAGQVTDLDGDPVPDVAITVIGADLERITRTGEDGAYALADLPPGDYVVTVTPPPGGSVSGPASRQVSITDEGEEVTAQDFVVVLPQPAPTFAAGGTVLDPDGEAVPGAAVSVRPAGGGDPVVVPTDPDGGWLLPDQPAGEDYQATVLPPDGYQVVDGATLTFDIIDEDITDLDFVIGPVAQPSPSATTSPSPSASASPSRSTSAPPSDSPSPTPSTTTSALPTATSAVPTPGSPGGPGDLADTGGPAGLLGLVGFLALAAGAGLLVRPRAGRHW